MQFKVVTADPPWPESGGGRRGAQMHYALIKRKEDILRVMLDSGYFELVGDNAHLYLWATNTYLPWALWLIDQLGFTYKTTIAWVKLGKWTVRPHDTAANRRKLAVFLTLITAGRLAEATMYLIRFGIGQYFRGAHELCLFAVKGKGYAVRTAEKGLPGVIVAPKGRHSEKPVAFYELVEKRSHGPRVELFARSGRAGWTSWGNESSREK